MSKCSRIIFSDKAYNSIAVETYDKMNTETGGILLGFIEGDTWYVIENIPPGPKSVFRPAFFEYDTEFVNYLANVIEKLYQKPPILLGLWHRHPGSFDRFSATDDETNTTYASLNKDGAISGLVNVDPNFRLTMYHVLLPLDYTTVKYEVGDQHIPQEYLALKTLEDIRERTKIRPENHNNYLVTTAHKFGQTVHHLGQAVHNTWRSVQTSINPPSPDLSASKEEEILLDMLDTEYSYLERQKRYNCIIVSRPNSITVAMTPITYNYGQFKKLEFVFYLDKNTQEKKVSINQEEFLYAPEIIQVYIEDILGKVNPRGKYAY